MVFFWYVEIFSRISLFQNVRRTSSRIISVVKNFAIKRAIFFNFRFIHFLGQYAMLCLPDIYLSPETCFRTSFFFLSRYNWIRWPTSVTAQNLGKAMAQKPRHKFEENSRHKKHEKAIAQNPRHKLEEKPLHTN